MSKIVVFGSFVADLTARASHLPKPGETVMGSSFRIGPGGKGFNQAVAAHKAGADVVMVTKVGCDAFASIAIDAMNALGMDTAHVLQTDKHSTGAALIAVDEVTGQNEIVVVPGACAAIEALEVEALRPLLADAQILLTQLETNLDATWAVIRMAKELGATIILNTAPAQSVPDEILELVDVVTPNEVEAELISGIAVDCIESANMAADWFLQKGVSKVVITLGSKGAFLKDATGEAYLPARKVKAIDTTGAGDAFNGGLVAGLAEGLSLFDAAKFATALASLSVQRLGTTPSMPSREEIDFVLQI